MTKPFRCHDADACAGGFNRCPMPWACGVESEASKFAQTFYDSLPEYMRPREPKTEKEKQDANDYYDYHAKIIDDVNKSMKERIIKLMPKMPKALADAFNSVLSPTCCDVNSIDCRQWRDCLVRSGEYKPADAMHHIQEPSK